MKKIRLVDANLRFSYFSIEEIQPQLLRFFMMENYMNML